MSHSTWSEHLERQRCSLWTHISVLYFVFDVLKSHVSTVVRLDGIKREVNPDWHVGRDCLTIFLIKKKKKKIFFLILDIPTTLCYYNIHYLLLSTINIIVLFGFYEAHPILPDSEILQIDYLFWNIAFKSSNASLTVTAVLNFQSEVFLLQCWFLQWVNLPWRTPRRPNQSNLFSQLCTNYRVLTYETKQRSECS